MTAGAAVREFYDANTWKFLLAGSHRGIHRELWGPGVTNRHEALDHVHALVLGELGRHHERVLDLGCGVGAAARYLVHRRPLEVVGVSISPEQVRLAERFAARAGSSRSRLRFEVADFTELPRDLVGFDLAFAIESFVHADPASAFFHQAARSLRPGGALLIVDDFCAGDVADGRLDDFRSGWHTPSLISVAEASALAVAAGLVLEGSHNLSRLQRLGRPRDQIVRALQPVLRRARHRSAWARALVGGHALQACHRAGLLEYRLLRFVRRTG